MVTNSSLHYTIIKEVIEKGFAPDVKTLSSYLHAEEEEVVKGLHALQEYHGVVLHPNEPKVWAIHPFSLAPTNFYVKSKEGEWWGNCAWCCLGIAALLKKDVKILTSLGGEAQRVEINIVEGELQEKNYFIHFPIPMKNAWDNVVYTCSNMLVFENEEQVNRWCQKHNIPKGDIQPINKIWAFAKKWYSKHLDEDWTKWTVPEAKQIFKEFDLGGEIWDLGDSNERF